MATRSKGKSDIKVRCVLCNFVASGKSCGAAIDAFTDHLDAVHAVVEQPHR